MRELVSQTETKNVDHLNTELLLLATLQVVGERGAFNSEIVSILLSLQQNYPANPSETMADQLDLESRVIHIVTYLRWGNCLDERGIKLRLAEAGEKRVRETLSRCLPGEYAQGVFWAQVMDAVGRTIGD